jgi:hypothetical protein
MKILVACEESQAVTIAFRNKGHEAYSCDIQDCSGGFPEWHLKGDVRLYLKQKWDMIITHPTCKYLANSGVCWIYKDSTRMDKVKEAAKFFMLFYNHPCEKICIENPIPHKYGELPKYTQIIQPYMFGHTESKATCLWLKGLPKLKETNNVKSEMLLLPKNISQRLHYLPPGPEREKLRSKTYTGIAAAMAEQWA